MAVEMHGYRQMETNRQTPPGSVPRDSLTPPPNAVRPSVHERLIESFQCLERLEAERAFRRDPHFAKFLERRIVLRELVELELYEVDGQIAGIASRTGTGAF